MQLSGSGRGTLDFGESFVEDLCDIEETNDVAIFVANGLKICSNQGIAS
jgi:hypothetical protein